MLLLPEPVVPVVLVLPVLLVLPVPLVLSVVPVGAVLGRVLSLVLGVVAVVGLVVTVGTVTALGSELPWGTFLRQPASIVTVRIISSTYIMVFFIFNPPEISDFKTSISTVPILRLVNLDIFSNKTKKYENSHCYFLNSGL